MEHIFVYGDSLTWGIIPDSRRRLPFERRWPGILETLLVAAGRPCRVIEDCLNGRRTAWEDPLKAGRNGLHGLGQRIEAHSPLDLAIVMLGTNDFQASHQNEASHSAEGIAAVVRAVRSAPVEPGMSIPPILIVAPPPIGIPKGTIAAKFLGADARCRGVAEAYRRVAEEEKCAFLDAGSVTSSSVVDGIHLDSDQHERLGKALAREVARLLPK